MLNVEYCGLNGMIVETDVAIYIFDYTIGELPSHYLMSKKPLHFLVSRNDVEHFSKSIESYHFPIITSYDFQSMKLKDSTIMEPYDTLHLGYSIIHALPTTRRGLCFIIKETKNTLFFGGDFNLWHWPNMYSEAQVHEEFIKFYTILKEVQKHGSIDLAIMGVNPVMRVDMGRGAREFIQLIQPKNFIPIAFKNKDDLKNFELWALTQDGVKTWIPSNGNEMLKV